MRKRAELLAELCGEYYHPKQRKRTLSRKTFSETRKSKWLGAKERKPRPEPKPIFPLQKGTLTCHAIMENGKVCDKDNDIEAHSQLTNSYPVPTFWVVSRCRGCGSYLAGFATVVRENIAP